MKKLMFALSAFAAAAACTAGAQTGTLPPASIAPAAEAVHPLAEVAPVACAILADRTANGMRFSAVASAGEPASGSYEFVLTKRDRNGSSDISQGGAFDLAPGGDAALGETELNLERRSTYRARLVLWDDSGEVCRAERAS